MTPPAWTRAGAALAVASLLGACGAIVPAMKTAPGAAPAHCAPAVEGRAAPRLILLVVVDQFRVDALSRFWSRYTPPRDDDGTIGGFRYLASCGSAFTAAEHDVLQAMTAPGHASIATGAWPYRHGIVVNKWFDPATGEKAYCVGDPEGKLIGIEGDPPGRSPRNLFGPTLGDTLKNAGLGSRVVSIALKDRAATLMGGHRPDAAIWMHADSLRWTTSSFYRPAHEFREYHGRRNGQKEKDDE